MGSSYDACYPAVAELAVSGIAAVMLDSAELLHFRAGMLGARTLLVTVSQSGESAEIVRLVRELRDRREPPIVVGVSNGLNNSLAGLAEHALDTVAGVETGPSTMTFAASLVVLAALARVLAEEPVEKVLEEITEHAEVAAAAMERLLGDASLPDRLAAWLGERGTIVILGRGPARAAAEMGALTIKEAVGIPVESLETAQFRHGPLELAGPDLAAIVIATEPETIALDLGLAEELLASGAAVLLVTQGPVSPTGATRPRMQPGTYPGMQPGMYVELGEVNRALAPAVSILPAQLLAWRLASLRGREPGSYYRASKVTTRE